MERENVESSLIASLGYDSSTSILEVEFKKNGDIWQYYDVPQNVYSGMMNASIGKYFLAYIKGHYKEFQVK